MEEERVERKKLGVYKYSTYLIITTALLSISVYLGTTSQASTKPLIPNYLGNVKASRCQVEFLLLAQLNCLDNSE